MLPPPRGRGDPFDPALLLGRAKLDEAATLDDGLAALTRAELLAVLGNAAAIRQLERLQLGAAASPNPARPAPASCRNWPRAASP